MADLSPLRDAGIPIDTLADEQRASLETLSQEEIDTLAAINRKVNSSGEDERASAACNIVW